jgi:hypothetical protein
MFGRPLAPTLVAAALALGAVPAGASDPASDAVAAPAPGQPDVTATWSGTIPPGTALPTNSCDPLLGGDPHTTTVTVPAGAGGPQTTATFTIAWSDPSNGNDERLEVDGPGGQHLSDTSTPAATSESVQLADPVPGDYTVTACPSSSLTPQDYAGRVTVANAAPPPPPTPTTTTATDASTAPPSATQPAPPPTSSPLSTSPPPAASPSPRSSARLRITSVVRRGRLLRVTLRTSNGAIRGARVTVTRDRHTVASGTAGRIGVAGVTLPLRPVHGAQLVRDGRLRPGTYRISVVATGASRARTGGVILLS